MPRGPHPLASVAQILETPSAADGVPADLEADLRVAGCMLIQEAGILMDLPQSTMATAQVVFHRFFYVSSMFSFGVNDLSVSSLYLATKLNETSVRLRDLINTYIFLQARIQHLLSLPADQPLSPRAGPSLSSGRNWNDGPGGGGGASPSEDRGKGKSRQMDEMDEVWKGFKFEVPSFHSPVFWEWKEAIQYNELQILKRLGFNMQVDLPYSHVINYLKILDLVFEEGVAQLCWSVLNDALLTPLYAQQPTHVLAVSSILLATRLHHIPLPPDWWLLFDVDLADAHACCATIMRLYDDWGMGSVGSLSGAGGAGAQEGNGVGGGLRNGESGGEEEGEAKQKEKEARWRRAWVLMESRRAVRRWVEERKGTEEVQS